MERSLPGSDRETALDHPWQTVLFNDEVHSFDEVVLQVQRATGYSLERSSRITLKAHQKGRAIVIVGDREKAEKAAAILELIGLTVKVERT